MWRWQRMVRGVNVRMEMVEVVVEDECFFFFQAEDGIRDGHVTGVQTCALPIFRGSDRMWTGANSCQVNLNTNSLASGQITTRSEERRVGKECRSRWSPYQ